MASKNNQNQDKAYLEMTEKASPNSPIVKNCIKVFLIGGLICAFGELLFYLYGKCGFDEETVKSLVSTTIIAITAILTGVGLFDDIAKHAGAGTLVPITGFANSVVSPAMEFQTEGRILGTGAKMFAIAGPVIVYGCGTATLYGVIYFICSLF